MGLASYNEQSHCRNTFHGPLPRSRCLGWQVQFKKRVCRKSDYGITSFMHGEWHSLSPQETLGHSQRYCASQPHGPLRAKTLNSCHYFITPLRFKV